MGDSISGAWDAISGGASDIVSGVGDIAGDIVGGVGDVVGGLGDAVGNAISDITSSNMGKLALIAAAIYAGVPPDLATGMTEAELTAAAADAGATIAADGSIDLGGGIVLGADGSVAGGTFTGGTGLTGNAATDALTGLSSGNVSAGDVLSGLSKANSAMGLAQKVLGFGAKGAGARMMPSTGTGGNTTVNNIKQQDPFLPEANFSYEKVSNNSDFVNPLLFSLAGFGNNPTSTVDPLGSLDTSLGTSDNKQPTTPTFAEGGLASAHPAGEPEFYSEGGLKNMYIEGRGDGTSDDIPAMVANNEFVIPADIVAALGNGSSDAGGSVLDKFVATIREHKHSNPPDELPPQSKGPLEYLASAAKKGHA